METSTLSICAKFLYDGDYTLDIITETDKKYEQKYINKFYYKYKLVKYWVSLEKSNDETFTQLKREHKLSNILKTKNKITK